MHKRVAGPTERNEILKHIVGDSLSVLDMVEIDALIGSSTPATPPSVARVNLATEGGR